jgi:uncharacterized membrane protein YbhN (UPF0104 family)
MGPKGRTVDENRQNTTKRRILTLVKLAIVLLVVWFIRRTIVDAWEQLGERRWQFDLAWLTASGSLYLLGKLLCGVFWYRTLQVLKQPATLARTLRAYYVGELGKYVPGKAMVVVLRTGMVRGPDGDTGLIAASVFYETLTMMSTGALIGAAIVAVWFRGQTLLVGAALAMMAAAGLPTLPPVFRRLVRLFGIGRSDPAIGEKLADLGYGTMLLGWVVTGVGWVLLGLSFWAMLRGMGVDCGGPFDQLHLHTAAVTLATVAGFISFVPGGAIVREAVLAQLMVPYLGDAVALVSAILLRLVWLIAELLISGILYVAIRRHVDNLTKG